MFCPSEPSKEVVKVSHVIFECRVINHHPKITNFSLFDLSLTGQNNMYMCLDFRGKMRDASITYILLVSIHLIGIIFI